MIRARRSAAGTLALALLFPAAPAPATAAPPSEKASSRKRPARVKVVQAKPSSPEPRFLGEPISLDLKDADLKDVLRTFAELAKVNIVIDPGVRGSVTIRLQDVPWDQALDVILRVNGLGYVLERNILRIGEPGKLVPRG
jgi:type IV pilus assembly protein PilQ